MTLSFSATAQERPFRESVSISTDADTAKSLRMIRDQWNNGPDAATLSALIELCESRGDTLVVQDRGVSGGIARFIRLQSAGDELIAGLSPTARATYRQRMDAIAEPWWKAWQTTGDARYLDRLVTRAFFSSWGDDAVWAAAHRHWNRGDYSTARRLWERLLPAGDEPVAEPRYPDSTYAPAEISTRMILCDIFAGRKDRAETDWKRFEETYPTAQGSLGGQSGRWVDLLKSAIQLVETWTPQVTSEDVVTFAGNDSRQRVAPKALDIGGELWSVSLPNPRLPAANRSPIFPQQLPLAFHPAVIDDLVLLNDGRQLHAWNLYSGKPYWDAGRDDGDVIYPLVADPLPMIPGRPVVGQAQWTATVAHGRVYARMGSAVTTPAATEFRDLPAEMVCLDISQGEGQLLWKQSAEELFPAEGDLPTWRWEGSPVVDSGHVYAVLSRRRPQLEWSMACLDAESGLLLWHRPIGITRPTPPDHENRASSLLLTAGGGQLFVVTGWGAVVAVEPRDGRVNWAVTYESNAATNGFTGVIPPVYVDGRLYAALLDGGRLACIDAPSGRSLWSRELTEPMREMLGVVQNRVVLSGRSLWGFNATSGKLEWSIPATDPDDWGYGRGTLAGDQILWTTSQTLLFVNQSDGRILREHPLGDSDAARSGGNVTVSHGVILIAGADRLTAYGEFARLREPLQQPFADRGRELRRELKLAEIAWASGQPQQAEALWDRIAKQTDSEKRSETQRAKSRLSLLPGRRSSRNTARTVPSLSVTAVAVTNKADALLPSTTTGYWQRAWRKPLTTPSHALLPERLTDDAPLGVLVDGATLSLWDPATGFETVLSDFSTKLDWCGQWPDRFVCVTDEEILVCNRRHPAVMHRLSRPVETLRDGMSRGMSTLKWIVHPAGLLVLAPPQSIALLDVQSGEWRWNRTAQQGGWQSEIGWNDHRLAIHPRGLAGTEIWDMATGRTRRREHPLTPPWKAAPRFDGHDDDYVAVTEDDRIVGHSAVTARRWEFLGIVSATHVSPWVFTQGDDCFAVIDGQQVVSIQRDSGWPRWSTAIADQPLRHPEQQIAVWNGRLFAANAGTVRAINLETGSLVWKTSLPETSRGSNTAQRCVVLDPTAAAPVMTVVPFLSPHDSGNTGMMDAVELISTVTGQRCQTLRLQSPARDIHAAAITTHRAVLVTEREAIGLKRP